MSKRYLVTYASRYGSTAEIAQRIGAVLEKHGLTVEVKPVAEAAEPGSYAGIVLGSPIYSADWPPDMAAFVHDHTAVLRATPVALFTTALRLRDGSDAMRESVMGTIERYRVRVAPVTIGLFAGALDYGKLPPIVRLALKSKNLPEGDFRNWDEIERWAESLPALFVDSL